MELLIHSIYYLSGRVATAAVGVLALYTFTRVLSPADYGRYSALLALAGLLSGVAFEWLRQCLVRFWTPSSERRPQLLGTIGLSFAALTSLSLLMSAIIFILEIETTEFSKVLIALIGILACAQSWFDLSLDARRAEMNPGRYSLIAFIRAALALAFGASLAALTDDLYVVILGIALGNLVASLFAPRWLSGLANFSQASIRQFGELVRYGLPISISLGFTVILNSADLVMLAVMNGSEQAGIYASAYNLAQYSIGTLLAGLGVAVLPLATRSYSEMGLDACGDLLGRNLTLLTAIAMPATVGLSLISPTLGKLLLGNLDPNQSAIITIIVASGIMLAAIRSYGLDITFMLVKQTKIQAFVLGFSAVFNVLLNMLLIPRWGSIGAAVSTLFSFGLAFILSVFIGRRYIKIRFYWFDLAKICLSTLVMGFVVWVSGSEKASPGGMFLTVMLGVIVYAIMVFSLNLAEVRSIVSRIYSSWRLF